MVNLHVCTLDKFIPPFIQFIRENFPKENNIFYIIGDNEKYSYTKDNNIFPHLDNDFKELLTLMKSSNKIILHGLFDNSIIRLLFLKYHLLKKCYWVIWGGDLYDYQYKKIKSVKELKRAFRKKQVIKNIGHLVTYIDGDVALARKIYKAKGIHVNNIGYLSNIVPPTISSFPEGTNILIGNSAAETNNHLEIIDLISQYNISSKIYAPLTYGGNATYKEKVIEYGKKKLGSAFIPLTEHMPISDYLFLLSTIKIAIFNHDRQQAMGNTIHLLGMGKTVYMRRDTSQWLFFEKHNIEVFDIQDLNFNTRASKKNTAYIQDYFSYDKLKQQWSQILEDK